MTAPRPRPPSGRRGRQAGGRSARSQRFDPVPPPVDHASRPALRRNWIPWEVALVALLAGGLPGAWGCNRVSHHRGPLLSWDEGGYVWKAHFTALGICTGDTGRVLRT